MSKQFKNRKYIIYDYSCPFCTGIAQYFEKNWDIEIVGKVFKDVHYVDGKIMYDGAEAIIRVLGTRYPVLISLYGIMIFRIMFKSIYWIVKKLRKHLGNLFLKS